ncbi:MAG TPA: polyhydroxyalkanoate depolymerase [Hyphomicrobium sp.]|nr:polyhydroxyalkanoate depolymerase [Hyphomicrobium sp.]
MAMHYYAYEMAHAVLSPLRFGVNGLRSVLDWPFNPIAATPYGRHLAAACELFENVTRRYGKPSFGLPTTQVGGVEVSVREHIVASTPFCNLVHFERAETALTGRRYDPKVLIVAPMSGHYATLLRGTVKAMLPDHEIYITDWVDARDIPLAMGPFDLDSFIDHVTEFIRVLGPDTHVMGVCQPAVPVLAAVAHMAAIDDPCQPASMVLMGGPIDTRRNPTAVNKLAEGRPIEWFEQNVISTVPFPHAGFMRPVYPGFMQLTGFMTMNLERHMTAHVDLFKNLVQGDCDSVKQHQTFYDEYLAVMDLTAEFYLQTVETVFQKHALPKGTMMHHGERVDCSEIRDTALLTIEGERDDITGLGQTEAAHDLCSNIPSDQKMHYVQEGVGHYGVFNGTRWRTEIQPRIREFIRTIEYERGATPTHRIARRMHHPSVAVSPV